MKTIRPFFGLILLVSIITMFSCGKEEYFMSEASVKKQLKGSWDLIPIPRTNPAQNWAFGDEKLTRSQDGNSQVGDFSVETTISKRRVKLENLPQISGQPDYNGTWEIVQLDDDFLIIATDKDGSTGLTELEFQKRK